MSTIRCVFSRPMLPAHAFAKPTAHFTLITHIDGCRFDYFTLTAGDGNAKFGQLAVLVAHPELGSIVLQVAPPPH